MNRTILQVPMPKELREKAEKVAAEQGFSSLQETIRVFLTRLAQRELTFQFTEEKEERLSAKAEKRYAKMLEDIKSGKNVTKTSSLEELFEHLNS